MQPSPLSSRRAVDKGCFFIYGWGSNHRGELGLGLSTATKKVAWPVKKKLEQVFGEEVMMTGVGRAGGCGASFSVLCMEKGGQTLACGVNESGQLGMPGFDCIHRFSSVRGVQGLNVVSISCGFDHVLCLTSEGTVWSWGETSSGQLGFSSWSSEPRKISALGCRKVKDISAGASHSMFVMEDGDVLGCGSNIKGQLGVGFASEVDDDDNRGMLRSVLLPRGVKAKSCACGGLHTVCLSEDGKLYAWGFSGRGQLGMGETMEQFTPTEVSLGDTDPMGGSIFVEEAACGFGHTIVLTRAGTLFSFGCGENGQLGHGSVKDERSPKPISALQGKQVKSVVCGRAHSAAYLLPSSVYTWGFNTDNQLGNVQADKLKDSKDVLDLTTFVVSRKPHSQSPVPLEVQLPDMIHRIRRLVSGPCSEHTFLLYKDRARYEIVRVLLIGVIKPGNCLMGKLPREGLACSILEKIVWFAANT